MFAVRCSPGGPRTRTRAEPLFSTVLGDDEGPIHCPRVIRLGLKFGRRKPLQVAQRWLREAGFADEQEARAALELPDRPYLCHPDRDPQPLEVASLDPLEGLRMALMLGLCTTTLYAPERPVLWTTTSLSRHLLLFDPRGFYA